VISREGGRWKKGTDALGDRFQREAKWEKHEYFKRQYLIFLDSTNLKILKVNFKKIDCHIL
jgi:hypothetical protein